MDEEKKKLYNLIKTGQLRISPQNIKVLALSGEKTQKELFHEETQYADLNIIGLRHEQVKHEGVSFFDEFNELGNIIFVNSLEEKYIK